MQLAPIPANEAERLQTVKKLGLLDTPPEERFDIITRAATEQLRVPISTISIIDEDREWYKSCQGIDEKEGARDISFCGHAMLSKIVYVVEDTLKDSKFTDNPHVTGAPYIRFYAGVSLRHDVSQHAIGVLCVKDIKPRQLTPDELGILLDLAKQAEVEINRAANTL